MYTQHVQDFERCLFLFVVTQKKKEEGGDAAVGVLHINP